ncbi:MAG: Lrp/AsnC ligand binding domain-containing protein, partial [Lachnospiraceae bacterium]|nr:Lrp/AsnC ligand binding domain-containing protein [Lachnospiraceae bacterium]
GQGFDKIAERIYKFDEVESVYLMSGGFDLTVIIRGKSMKEVSRFVFEKLAPMESIQSTATHFVLKKYKDQGLVMQFESDDERIQMNF